MKSHAVRSNHGPKLFLLQSCVQCTRHAKNRQKLHRLAKKGEHPRDVSTGKPFRDFLQMTHNKQQSLIGSVERDCAKFIARLKIASTPVERYYRLTSSRRSPRMTG